MPRVQTNLNGGVLAPRCTSANNKSAREYTGCSARSDRARRTGEACGDATHSRVVTRVRLVDQRESRPRGEDARARRLFAFH